MKSRIAKSLVQGLAVLSLYPFLVFAQRPELVVQTSHDGWIQSVTFSPDGRILATGDGAGTIKIWEIETGRQIRTIKQPSLRFDMLGERPLWSRSKSMSVNLFERFDGNGVADTISSLSFSPDGRTLASGGTDKMIRLWAMNKSDQIEDSTPDKIIKTPVRVWFVGFDDTGKVLLSVGEDNSYRFWDPVTLAEIVADPPSLNSFRIPWRSRDGRFTLDYEESKKTLAVLDSKTGETTTLGEHAAGITRAVFTPDGRTVASCGWDRTIRLWDIADGTARKILGDHDSFVSSIAFSTDGKMLASVGGDLKIKLWDLEHATERTLIGYGSRIEPSFLVQDENLLITKGRNVVQVWNLKNGQKAKEFVLHRGTVNLVAFDPNKQVLVTTDQTVNNLPQMTVCFSLIARNYRKSNEIRSTPETENCVVMKSLAASNVGPLILESFSNFVEPKSPDPLGSYDELLIADNLITLWDLVTEETTRLAGTSKHIDSVAISHDGNILVIGDNEGSLKLWRRSDNVTTRIEGHSTDPIKSIAIGASGTQIATVDDEDTLRFWALKANDGAFGLEPHMAPIKLTLERVLTVESFSEGVFTVFGWDSKNEIASMSYDFITAKLTKDPEMSLADPYAVNRLRQVVSHFAKTFTGDQQFVFKVAGSGRVGLFKSKPDLSGDDKLLAWLISLGEDSWAVVTPDGRFDTNRLEKPKGLNWVFPDAPLKPLPFEIFMRDYYEPRLLPRLLRGEKFPDVRSLAELNRVQPKIEKITVAPQSDVNLVTVSVEISSISGQCLRESKSIHCESGVYDLRLYRDGHLIRQSPSPSTDSDNVDPGTVPEGIEQWRKKNLVNAKNGNSITAASGTKEITFSNIQLPINKDASQVEFTAYAFNEDRVKSETSEPMIYKLPQPRPGAERRAYVITVGVDVTSGGWRLGFAPNGAREIERLLKERLGSQYKVVPVSLISAYTDDNASIEDLGTKGNLQTALNILAGRNVKEAERQILPRQEELRSASPDDLVVLYIASHGYADPTGKFYVVPSDIGEPAGVSEALLDRCLKNAEQSPACEKGKDFLRHSISSDELTQWLQAVDAGQMVLILDSCHSAAVSGPNFKPGPMGDRGFGQLSYDKGMLVLAATQAENLAWGNLELGDRSLLTEALINQAASLERRPFDLRQWLSLAQKQVPDLYKGFVRAQQANPNSAIEQEPAFFDFAKTHSAKN